MKPELAMRYLHSYAMRDIPTMELLFADNIIFHDWNGKKEGKPNALKYIEKLFKSPNSALFELDIVRVALGQDTIMVEFTLIVNKKPTLTMVNVIDYDQDDRIKSIRVYKL